MKFTLHFILLLCLISPIVLAQPTEDDRQVALKLLYTLDNGQEQTFIETSNYQSIVPRWYNGFVSYSCAYSTFDGKGYINTVTKIEDGKVYVIQRQYGMPHAVINESWTCVNCNGETYEAPKTNEHQLCHI